MKSGIYIIKSKSSNLIYLGGSIEIEKRWWRHRNDLINNNHHSIKLQEVFNLYGEEDLVFEVIKECIPSEVKVLEQEYLNNLDFNESFNLSKFSNCGDLISYHPNRDLIIEKIKASLNRRYSSLTPEDKKRIYGKVKEENGNWKGGLTYCECGNKKNYYAKKCLKCTDRSSINNPFYGKSHSEETKSKIREANKGKIPTNARRVKVGEVIFNSATHAAKELGCTPSTILNRINKGVKDYSFID